MDWKKRGGDRRGTRIKKTIRRRTGRMGATKARGTQRRREEGRGAGGMHMRNYMRARYMQLLQTYTMVARKTFSAEGWLQRCHKDPLVTNSEHCCCQRDVPQRRPMPIVALSYVVVKCMGSTHVQACPGLKGHAIVSPHSSPNLQLSFRFRHPPT